jgi:hypothetical protein
VARAIGRRRSDEFPLSSITAAKFPSNREITGKIPPICPVSVQYLPTNQHLDENLPIPEPGI